MDQVFSWGNKTKAIQADLGTFKHILAYSSILRHVQNLLRYIQAYSEPSLTPAYSEPRYIQNLDIFKIRNRSIFNPVKHHTWSILWKLLTAYSLFWKLFSQYQLFTFSISFLNKNYFLLQKYTFYIKNLSDPGDQEPWILICPCYVVIFFLQ